MFFSCIATRDPKVALREIAQREKEEAKLREELEQKRLEAIRANKKDKAVKEKLSRADQKKEDEKTNMTALNAIGNTSTKKRRRRTTLRKTKGQDLTAQSGTATTPTQNSPSTLQEVKRITYKDTLVCFV
eukprot:TRINITY_DN69296_c0_g1_i1.p3 TRINITY_DN69296_c0_g1~~TRINITY_DN69296_c0_g1_i1.p3  ORF type:complete len:130 (+),score=19.12 TRINITY_DN69296_c0_g1_i1:153-542(+)